MRKTSSDKEDFLQTEKEAKDILQKIGKTFNEDYHDDNSKNSMPDWQYTDGRFVEVTETHHKKDLVTNPRSCKLTFEELSETIPEAYKRYTTNDYPEGCGYSRSADEKYLKNVYGYDKETQSLGSEFKSKLPVIEHNVRNILKVIGIKDKKHKGKDIDLFVFVTGNEFRLLQELIAMPTYDTGRKSFFQKVCSSCFKEIYICGYCYAEQKLFPNYRDYLIKINTATMSISKYNGE